MRVVIENVSFALVNDREAVLRALGDGITTKETGLRVRVHNSILDHSYATRLRVFFTNENEPDWTLPEHGLVLPWSEDKEVPIWQLRSQRLDLSRFRPKLAGEPDARDTINALCTSIAGRAELERVNAGTRETPEGLVFDEPGFGPSGAPRPALWKEVQRLAMSRETGAWDNFTLEARAAIMGLERELGLLEHGMSFSGASAAYGLGMFAPTITRIVHSFTELQNFRYHNILLGCNEVGHAFEALRGMRRVGLIRPFYLITFEVDDETRHAFERMVEAEGIPGMIHLSFGDMYNYSGECLRALFAAIGGIHLFIAGPPCTNWAGSNRANTANGRTGVEGPASRVMFLVGDYLRAACTVEPAFNRIASS